MKDILTYEDMMGACSKVTTYANYFVATCPFHKDDSPSLMVYKDKWFRCLGCEKHGTWKTLWNKLKGQPVQVMPERRTRWNLPRIPEDGMEEACYQAHMDLLGFPSLGWYLEMRGLEDRIEVNELGYLDGWYTIPVRSRENEFITAVFRAAPHVQNATDLRYYCPHKPVMFVPDWLLFLKSKYVVIVYGMLDALALASLRIPVATTTGGQLTFDPIWLEDVRKPIWIAPDAGEEKAARKLAKDLGWRARVKQLNYPDGVKDPAGFLQVGMKNELANQLGGL